MELAVAVTGALFAAAPVRAEDGWAFELYGGSAYSVATPRKIRQSGQSDSELTAHYATRPWTDSPYYAFRFGRWANGRAWEVELLHDKLYLKNPPPEVQLFEITHGFNVLFVNRAWLRHGIVWRLGGGVVIAHPENTIRGRSLPGDEGNLGDGFYLTGPALQFAAARRVPLGRRFFFAVEGKTTAAYARVPVEGGHAVAPNVALHGLLGSGAAFGAPGTSQGPGTNNP